MVLNPILLKQLAKKRDEFRQAGIPFEVSFAFHGTKDRNLKSIVETGLDPAYLGKTTGNNGFYGSGVYFNTKYVNPQWNYNRYLMCLVLQGNRKPVSFGVGQAQQAGYQSHYGDSGMGFDELCIFDKDQIIPLYVVHSSSVPYWHYTGSVLGSVTCSALDSLNGSVLGAMTELISIGVPGWKLGIAIGEAVGSVPASMLDSALDLVTDTTCLETCHYSGDGICHDGGWGSSFSICDFGTDCSDCGARYTGDPGTGTRLGFLFPTVFGTAGAIYGVFATICLLQGYQQWYQVGMVTGAKIGSVTGWDRYRPVPTKCRIEVDYKSGCLDELIEFEENPWSEKVSKLCRQRIKKVTEMWMGKPFCRKCKGNGTLKGRHRKRGRLIRGPHRCKACNGTGREWADQPFPANEPKRIRAKIRRRLQNAVMHALSDEIRHS